MLDQLAQADLQLELQQLQARAGSANLTGDLGARLSRFNASLAAAAFRDGGEGSAALLALAAGGWVDAGGWLAVLDVAQRAGERGEEATPATPATDATDAAGGADAADGATATAAAAAAAAAASAWRRGRRHGGGGRRGVRCRLAARGAQACTRRLHLVRLGLGLGLGVGLRLGSGLEHAAPTASAALMPATLSPSSASARAASATETVARRWTAAT